MKIKDDRFKNKQHLKKKPSKKYLKRKKKNKLKRKSTPNFLKNTNKIKGGNKKRAKKDSGFNRMPKLRPKLMNASSNPGKEKHANLTVGVPSTLMKKMSI